jgi:hypothetical protein
VFAQRWEDQNTPRPGREAGTMDLILCSKGDGRILLGLTQAEATAAATAIQWLGSPVGFGWLEDALAAAGYDVVERKGAKRG